MHYIKIFTVLGISIFITTACRQETESTKVKQSADTNLIVVTNSDALEMLLALGADKNIVGISDASKKSFISQTKNMALIGNWRNPNIEAIVNLKPDIVVTYKQWPEPEGFDDKLSPFKIRVERINAYKISEYQNNVQRLASFVGKEDKADSLADDFIRILELAFSKANKVKEKKKVYFEFSDFTALGPGTGSDEILSLANTINIATPLKISYPKISTEWLLEENPDVIFKTITADTITEDMYKNLVERMGWNKLKAVKEKNVFLISSEVCSGPRAMIGALYIAKCCYPDVYSDVDPDSVHISWMKKYHHFVPSGPFLYSHTK
jgi:iron complex transport system substrate-binding protein